MMCRHPAEIASLLQARSLRHRCVLNLHVPKPTRHTVVPVLHFRGKIHLHLRGLQISSNLADSSVVRHQPTRHRFEPPDVAAFHSLAATILNIFAFGSVVLMAATERPNSGGVIEDQTAVALVAFAITILVCVPLFLASIGLAIYACYKHDPWGFAALFLNCLLIGGLILSTLLTLLIVPAAFSLADGLEKRLGPWLRTRLLTFEPEHRDGGLPQPAE